MVIGELDYVSLRGSMQLNLILFFNSFISRFDFNVILLQAQEERSVFGGPADGSSRRSLQHKPAVF
jgi:hypothetical protein